MVKQAVLPDQLEEITLADMILGEIGYTVPWAMFSDEKGFMYLHGAYNFGKEMRGTSTMKVTKTADGYEVDVQHCPDSRWRKSVPEYAGNIEFLPVSKLITS